MFTNIPRVVIAGTSSGVGKTTIVTGLLAALKRKGLKVQSYKVGPDYIDPGYHRLASGKPAHNLDTWLVPEQHILNLFAKTSENCDIAVIEGVMGLYDGGRFNVSSTAQIAKLLNAPVILVVDAKSMGASAAAVALGFKQYDSDVNLAGVIVNRLGSDTHKQMVMEALHKTEIRVFGAMSRNRDLALPERHLGLTPITEHDALETVSKMCCQVSSQLHVDEILEVAKTAQPIAIEDRITKVVSKEKVRIGVAHDEVFSFYYPGSLDYLEKQGAELILFSPLKDRTLPDVDGLILGGGFPEMFVSELAANKEMKKCITQAANNGIPIYAECGGLMYLCRQIVDFEGKAYNMIGLVPAVCKMQDSLQTVGYVETIALNDNVLCSKGDILRGHEFHFSTMIPDGDGFPWAFSFRKMRTGAKYQGGYAQNNILASYLHMHFLGNQQAAEHFITKCQAYKRNR